MPVPMVNILCVGMCLCHRLVQVHMAVATRVHYFMRVRKVSIVMVVGVFIPPDPGLRAAPLANSPRRC